ncbi:hypothetical protein ANN_10015 [Periplaneta americana]|uniref:Uncharacterized protein n=1 Tax=Periplaneta americana TaxID=6978 RepID=A0ABQ8TRL1_PERAM|nr:hypothetical protein ANN_10015 [Periplaneta americana]
MELSFWHVSLSTMHTLRAFADSVAENGTTSYTHHVSNLPTTIVSLATQTVAKVRYSHLTFPTLAFLRCVLEYSVQSVFFFVAAIALVATVSAGPMPGPFPLPAKDLKGSEAVYYGYSAYPYATYPAAYGYAYYG